MNRMWALVALALVSPAAGAQGPIMAPPMPGAGVEMPEGIPDAPLCAEPAPVGPLGLTSNRNFPNFIGFVGNPLQNIDPRALTQIMPIFGNARVSPAGPLPDGNFQILGPAVTLGITDRLAVGLNQGGYAFANFNAPNGRPGPVRDRIRARLADRAGNFDGYRDGFLNLGGFIQYTLIEDVPNQFLLSAGLRMVVPCGSYEIFQGRRPATMAPYVTVGKEIEKFHILATAGYQFPTGSGDRTANLFYANVHLDRQFFGCFYPLVEVNWTNHTSTTDVDLLTRRGYIDFGTFSNTGNVVTLAVGFNVVLIQDCLEIGAVYGTPLMTERDFNFDSVLVKMVLRF